jgi:hypothetical protein
VKEPETIPLPRLRNVLTALGFDPDLQHVRQIHIDPERVTVTRYQTDEAGHHLLAPGSMGILTVTSTHRVVGQ